MMDPIRPGNPNKLTKRQHVLARASIARFAGQDGRVEVWSRRSGKIERCKPGHSFFWVHRGWDEPSEKGMKGQIEDPFQALADSILAGKRELTSSDQRLITRFQQLWALRVGVRQYPRKEVELPIPSGLKLTQAQQENLEANGYSFAVGQRMFGPQVGGLVIRTGLQRVNRSDAAKKIEWSVVESRETEFLVPDSFRTIRTVPLSPNCCLIAMPGGPHEFSAEATMHINTIAAIQCVAYCFARDFSKTSVVFQAPRARASLRPAV